MKTFHEWVIIDAYPLLISTSCSRVKQRVVSPFFEVEKVLRWKIMAVGATG
jgi:hypothetical protein